MSGSKAFDPLNLVATQLLAGVEGLEPRDNMVGCRQSGDTDPLPESKIRNGRPDNGNLRQFVLAVLLEDAEAVMPRAGRSGERRGGKERRWMWGDADGQTSK